MTEAIRQGDIPGVQLRQRVWLAGRTREEAWSWLTEPRLIGSWLADQAVGSIADGLELRTLGEGGAIVETLRTVAPEDRQHRDRGHRILELELRRSDWRVATRLTFSLSPDPGGCELSVLHHGFQHLPLSSCLTAWEAYRERWAAALVRLEQALRC